MKALMCSLTAMLFAASASAQVTAGVFADTQLLVTANTNLQALPPGTPLPSQTVLTIVDPGPMCPSSATSRVVIQPAGQDTVVRFENTSVATGNLFFCGGTASTGNHAVRVLLSARTPTAGRLLVTTSVPTALSATFQVDVGADGSVELESGAFVANQVAGELEMPVVLDQNAIVVRVAVHTIAVAPVVTETRTMDVEVRFRPGPGRLNPFNPPCGASLTGWYVDDPVSRRRIELRASTALANPLGFFVFGFQPGNTPLPPSNCPLLANVIVVLPTAVSVGGDAGLTIPLPGPPPPPLQFVTQFVAATQTLGGVVWRTSEGMTIVLP